MDSQHKQYLLRAIELAQSGMDSNQGGPFGAVIVKNGQVIAEASNQVTADNDPTAHAEVVAIRRACAELNSWQLDGCLVYTSCEPCPMCLGAIYWARPSAVYFGASASDATAAGFDDSLIYNEIAQPLDQRKISFIHLPDQSAIQVFQNWQAKQEKINY